MRGIMIAGTHSGCGKSTISLGLMAALKRQGLAVQPFKAGPDFIDAGLHRLMTGRPSRNLDIWMCGKDYVKDSFATHSSGADIALVEGVMGMYDGDQSTAGLAETLAVPVLLVIDAYGMAESAGAVVDGFLARQKAAYPSLKIAGVIFNRVASERHFRRVRDSVRDVPVLGFLSRDAGFSIPHRHLGLHTAEDNPLSGDSVEGLSKAVLESIDIDRILKAAEIGAGTVTPAPKICSAQESPLTLAVAHDRAFCFYYEDNLDMLKDAGFGIKYFSPMSDKTLPEDADAVYLGGGYPELHASELSANSSMLGSIRSWASSGRPVYAECGGMMYLSSGITDGEGGRFGMAGVFPFETRMRTGRSFLGYREALLRADCMLGVKGEKIRGHEFHYSEVSDDARPADLCYSLYDSSGIHIKDEGYRIKNILASYVHLHFGGSTGIADSFRRFVEKALAG